MKFDVSPKVLEYAQNVLRQIDAAPPITDIAAWARRLAADVADVREPEVVVVQPNRRGHWPRHWTLAPATPRESQVSTSR